MSSKRQTTFAKIQREQAVKERRARKQQRKQERRDEKRREAEQPADPVDGVPEHSDDALQAP